MVIAVPAWFEEVQREALVKATEDAGVKVLQLIDDIAAAALQSITTPTSDLKGDRTQLVIDLGSSSLSLAILSIRQGLIYPLASSSDPAIGADLIDEKLVKFFAKDFTRKTKIPLSLPVTASSSATDRRAEAKLRLAIEHTKRTISASPGAATCSVESLKEGYDLSGTINRMRFDMEAREVYSRIAESAKNLVTDAGLDLHDVDEIVYAGGTGCLPGLDETVLDVGFNRGTVNTPFSVGTAVGGGGSDPTTILAKGAVLQAKLLSEIAGDHDLLPAFGTDTELTSVKATNKTFGLIFPEGGAEDGGLGGQWIPLILKETALPARRTFTFYVDLGENNCGKVGFEVWEVKESVKVDLVKVSPPEGDGEDEEEEPEETEQKEKLIEKVGTALTSITVPVNDGRKEKGRWKTKIGVRLVVDEGGEVEITAWEVDGGKKVHKVIQQIPV